MDIQGKRVEYTSNSYNTSMFHYARRIRSSVCIYFGLVGQQCKLNFKYLRRILNEIWFKIVFPIVAEDYQKLFQNKAEDVSFRLVCRLMGVGALIRALGWTAHHIPRYYPGTTVGTVRLKERHLNTTHTLTHTRSHVQVHATSCTLFVPTPNFL